MSFFTLLFKTAKLYGSSHLFVTVKMKYAPQYMIDGIAARPVQMELVNKIGFSNHKKLVTANTGEI